LIVAVHAFFHALEQQAGLVLADDLVPVGAPDDLDDIPTGAAEDAFEFLDDLAIAADRAVEASVMAPRDSGSSISPSPRNAQTFGSCFQLTKPRACR
jgi:hypothetical protein